MIIIMLILAYGPLNWVFPWWLWTLVIASHFLQACGELVKTPLKEEIK